MSRELGKENDVKLKKYMMFAITVFLLCSALVAPALAIEESEVESAIAASSREEVAGNIFIWFLCAIAFLKVSQKIDSFMSALGINVGRTGGSMLGELMIAGRAIGAAAGAAGGAISNIFNQNHSRSNTTNQAAGQAFPGHGGGLVSVAKRAAGNAAASSATGRSSGIGSFVGGAMFGSSMRGNGRLAQDVVSAVATGNFSSVGSITGEKASQALCNYLGYTAGGEQGAGIETEPLKAAGQAGSVTFGEDHITEDGGAAAGAAPIPSDSPVSSTIPQREGIPSGVSAAPSHAGINITGPAPSFRNVEIGGGRITGYETPVDGGVEQQFAMYNAKQYMEPTGPYETVQTVDGESWYKQYAQPVVQRTPYKDAADHGKVKYDEKIVQQLPQVPKRKDKI